MFIGGFLEHFHLISVTQEGSGCHKPVQLYTKGLEESHDGQCTPSQLLPLQ